MKADIITIDIGTSSCKVALFSDTGEIMAKRSESYSLLILPNGWVEQDPELIFRQVVKALHKLEEADVSFETVRGISLCAQISAQFLVDKTGRPLTNMISWMDQRAKKETLRFTGDFQREELEKITGMDMVVTPAYSIPKLMWMKENISSVLKESKHFVQIKDYVIYRLTGNWISDFTSLKGLVDQREGRPLQEIWRYLDLSPQLLPEVRKPYEIAGRFQRQKTGLKKIPADIPVVTGWNDMNAAFLGMGALLENGIGLDMTGTSEHLGWVGKTEPVSCEEYRGNNRIPFTEGTEAFYGVSSSSGLTIEWYVHKILKEADISAYIEAALKDFYWKDVEGLLFLPYLEGERNPWNNPDASGVFFGLKRHHEQKHLMAAVLEGICFELRAIFDCLPKKPTRIIVSGGASENKIWNQMKADIFNVKVQTIDVKEAGCTGAEILAQKALNDELSLEEISHSMIHTMEEFCPREECHSFYRKEYSKFIELYQTVEHLF